MYVYHDGLCPFGCLHTVLEVRSRGADFKSFTASDDSSAAFHGHDHTMDGTVTEEFLFDESRPSLSPKPSQQNCCGLTLASSFLFLRHVNVAKGNFNIKKTASLSRQASVTLHNDLRVGKIAQASEARGE